MCLVTPGAAMIGSIMLWDETPLRRLSWLTPNCGAIHLLFNTVCTLQESNGKKNTVTMCYLFALSPFKCTKVKQVQLTVPVIVNWSTHLSVNPSFFKPDFSPLLFKAEKVIHSAQPPSGSAKSGETKQTQLLTHHFTGLQLCYTLKLAKWPWWRKHQLSIIDYLDFCTFT